MYWPSWHMFGNEPITVSGGIGYFRQYVVIPPFALRCGGCGHSILLDWVEGKGLKSRPTEYELIGDVVFHPECWNGYWSETSPEEFDWKWEKTFGGLD